MRIEYDEKTVRKAVREHSSGMTSLASRSRMGRARAKLAVDRGDFASQVYARIDEVYESDYARERVKMYVSLETNPMQRLTDAVSVCYKVPPLRRIGDTDRLTKSFVAASRAARLNAAMRRASRVAFQTGVCWLRVYPAKRTESPMDVAGKMMPECELITPASAVRAWYGSDPRHPDMLLAEYASVEDDRIRYVLHDAYACHYLDAGGGLVMRREHAMNMPPLAEVRVDEPDDDDPWDSMRNDRLLTATIEVARLIAHIRWIRKSQSFMLMQVTGEVVSEMSEGQRINPETGIAVAADPDAIRIDVHNMDISVKNAEEEIQALLSRLAESYGLNQRSVDAADDKSGVTDSQAYTPREHAALADLRDRQLMSLEDADRAACVRLSRVAEVCRMECPKPERVWRDLEVQYAPLSYIDQPMARVELAAEKIKLGLTHHAEVYQWDHPHLSLTECDERVRENINMRNEYNELLAKHQIPLDPRQEGETAAARQGRIGGITKSQEMVYTEASNE